jgi:A/G-specific adenine glycosylase
MTASKSGSDHQAVLNWGRDRLRDLPWRSVRDPWWILISEVMSQQTTISRVVDRWRICVASYPTPQDLAVAPLGDLLVLWEGLGYPRRARNLHAAAGVILSEHDGQVPDDLDALLALPGVGPYTARAVLAFAFERDVGVVDANTARVLARVTGHRLTAALAQGLADQWVPKGEGWAWNQILMDLGHGLCRPVPRCEHCPLAERCAWQTSGHSGPDPATGSAGVSKPQARFEGSVRQQRGQVLKQVARAPMTRSEVGGDDQVIDSLIADGLLSEDRGLLQLPGR